MGNTILYNKFGTTVRHSTLQDVCDLKDSLRESDKLEIWASSRRTPEQALALSYLSSEKCFSILKDGKIYAMFGYAPDETKGVGSVWLLGSEGIRADKAIFLNISEHFIALMLNAYPILFNFVDARNKSSIKWLKWLGAEIAPDPIIYGVEQLPFYFFQFKKETKNV